MITNPHFLSVHLSICRVSSTQTQNHPEYDGPQIGPKIAEENKREFTQEQMDAGKHCVNAIQMGYTGGANQSGTNMGNTRHM